jgi:glycerol-3-phosphate dehydrogenase
MAGCSLPVQHSQGAMLVVERTGLDTVVNRCRPRTEGDIAVPFGSAAVLGTTDRPVEHPAAVDRDHAAVELLLEELGAMVPAVAAGSPYRAYWGVRALPADDGDRPTEVARSATVVDHEQRDGLWGLTSVFGGKLTTHRATAERVADQVCAALGINRSCETAAQPLPPVPPSTGAESSVFGADPNLCETSGVTRSDVRAVLDHDVVSRGSDLRPVAQLTGAGRGACQGARCAHRLAFEVDRTGAVDPIDDALEGFTNGRWAGRRFALWGDGFASAMAAYDFHARTLGRSRPPDSAQETPEWNRFDAGRGDATGEVTDV